MKQKQRLTGELTTGLRAELLDNETIPGSYLA